MILYSLILCFFPVLASLLRGLKHANIVTLHDIIHTKETLTFVFEYVVSIYLLKHQNLLTQQLTYILSTLSLQKFLIGFYNRRLL
jgi:hypothetical protein